MDDPKKSKSKIATFKGRPSVDLTSEQNIKSDNGNKNPNVVVTDSADSFSSGSIKRPDGTTTYEKLKIHGNPSVDFIKAEMLSRLEIPYRNDFNRKLSVDTSKAFSDGLTKAIARSREDLMDISKSTTESNRKFSSKIATFRGRSSIDITGDRSRESLNPEDFSKRKPSVDTSRAYAEALTNILAKSRENLADSDNMSKSAIEYNQNPSKIAIYQRGRSSIDITSDRRKETLNPEDFSKRKPSVDTSAAYAEALEKVLYRSKETLEEIEQQAVLPAIKSNSKIRERSSIDMTANSKRETILKQQISVDEDFLRHSARDNRTPANQNENTNSNIRDSFKLALEEAMERTRTIAKGEDTEKTYENIPPCVSDSAMELKNKYSKLATYQAQRVVDSVSENHDEDLKRKNLDDFPQSLKAIIDRNNKFDINKENEDLIQSTSSVSDSDAKSQENSKIPTYKGRPSVDYTKSNKSPAEYFASVVAQIAAKNKNLSNSDDTEKLLGETPKKRKYSAEIRDKYRKVIAEYRKKTGALSARSNITESTVNEVHINQETSIPFKSSTLCYNTFESQPTDRTPLLTQVSCSSTSSSTMQGNRHQPPSFIQFCRENKILVLQSAVILTLAILILCAVVTVTVIG